MRNSPRYQTSFTLSAFGVSVGVQVNRPDALNRLLPYLPIGWKPVSAKNLKRNYCIELHQPNGSAPATHLLYQDGKKIACAGDEQSLLDTFESHITIAVADLAPRRVFVHAGVVGWRGRAIVIPGRSFSGKTTLTAALVRAGASYYSDEYAIFDRQGRVHPYARPLHIRKDGESMQTKLAVENFGALVGSKPLRLGLVIATRYRKGANWHPRKISSGHGVLELLKNTVSARRSPEAALTAFQAAISGASVLRGTRGEVTEVAARILAEAERLSHSRE